jgi:deoxyribodipyrimidine photo-lyase
MLKLICFRRDFRLSDNELIWKACKDESPIFPFYIFDSWHLNHPEFSQGRMNFILESLSELINSFQKLNCDFQLYQGNSLDIIKTLIQSLQSKGQQVELYISHDIQYEYDKNLAIKINALGIDLNFKINWCFNDFLLMDESQMGSWREKYYEYQNSPIHPPPTKLITSSKDLLGNKGELNQYRIHLLPSTFTQSKSSMFEGGENKAIAKLNEFLNSNYQGYHWKLSRPWLAQQGHTSHLSPHLAQGCISSRMIYQTVRELRGALKSTKSDVVSNSSLAEGEKVEPVTGSEKLRFSLSAFQDRLRWRDSFRQKFFFHPEWTIQNRHHEFNAIYDNSPLSTSQIILYEAWKQGRTGFPLIDASMRQLLNNGWINFRMRAMCATFLTINLGISWHYGALHFMNYLIDGDAAIDHWQWQMQAGVTNPMSTGFRIYNPDKNRIERDPKFFYVRHWINELKNATDFEITSNLFDRKAINYPEKIIDWQQTKDIYGTRVSRTRASIRERLKTSNNSEFHEMIRANETVKAYYKGKRKRYEKIKNADQLQFDFDNLNLP